MIIHRNFCIKYFPHPILVRFTNVRFDKFRFPVTIFLIRYLAIPLLQQRDVVWMARQETFFEFTLRQVKRQVHTKKKVAVRCIAIAIGTGRKGEKIGFVSA